MNDISSESLRHFRRDRGLSSADSNEKIWLVTLGGLIVPLPNFRWRCAILAQHDAHHILTGYEPTLRGELSLATWELGVRCYANFWANILCGGLLCAGMLIQPKRTVRAYRKGRSMAHIYQQLMRGHFEAASFDQQ